MGSTAQLSPGVSADRKDVVIKINHQDILPLPQQHNIKEAELGTIVHKNNISSSQWKEYGYGSNSARDLDFLTDGGPSGSPASYGQLTPREVRVSFGEKGGHIRRRSNLGAGSLNGRSSNEVLSCSSSSSFRKRRGMMMTKTKSRLMDPKETEHSKCKPPRSGLLGKGSDIEEDDPFLADDLPDEYKEMKYSKLSIFQLVIMVLIIGFFACTLVNKVLRSYSIFDLELWKWELTVLVLICGRLVSGWGVRILVFFIERNFLFRKRVLYFVYGLRNAVQNCVWLTLMLVAWQIIFHKRVERVTDKKVLPYVTRLWISLLVGTFIWLLKTLLVKVLAMSFHVSTFFDRIQESLFNQYVIETLSGPPLIEMQQEQEEEDRLMAEVEKLQNAGAELPADLADLKSNLSQATANTWFSWKKTEDVNEKRAGVFSRIMSKKEQAESGITIDHLYRLNQKNVSAWNMKRLMNIVGQGVLSNLNEHVHETECEDESAVLITSEKQAKAAAKKIFNNVANPGSRFIFLENLMRFLREEEALKTIHLFDGHESKGISKRALKNWVVSDPAFPAVNVFRERRALALSLNDTKTAVNKLHKILNVAVTILALVISLLILRVATTEFFIFLSSQFVLIVFIFGNTCKTTFEAIIFLFVMHPYDVGDRVEIDTVQMVVEEMNILTTVFLKFDNHKVIYPNSVLATLPISNYYRSPDMGDAIDFCIHISTPPEKIAKMKERITSFVNSKSEHWYPAPMIVLRDVDDMNKLKWSVWLSHTINFQDMGERFVRRAILVEEMVKIFRELDMEYRMLPSDLNVRNLPPLTSTRMPSNWSVCA